MKIKNFCKLASVVTSIIMVSPAYAGNWVPCGDLSQINVGNCQLTNYPSTQYEYGIAYNSTEPLPVVCTTWNYGVRVYNKQPYMVNSDNPVAGMNYGGFIFYKGTLATDDLTCSGQSWRHKYWQLGQNNAITTSFTNGCYGADLPIYCRAHAQVLIPQRPA